jgi:DNA-binding transcriptional ArsR family regulator
VGATGGAAASGRGGDRDDGDAVFRALADAGRRALLDALLARDGRRLGELCDVLPGITRFGVMKHLAVLEAAHLIVTEKVGREKRHFLNPIPIQEIHERWMSKYAQPFARAMTGLRRQLESPADTERPA